ncbi:phosphotransferase [Bdellovibrio bacteriovorus]|uniref:phosphotransferase enzyme family protein n=1 Tax=Bdellovibrio bacteriovorus TaxID=959 RepID=UPI0021D06AE7|nr:phosphotransferase [Bdellovibrio bacteriovorus]UXR63503.1 phosphotransferase [Bdellovibrio bacteriovorus]
MKNPAELERLHNILKYWPLGAVTSVEEILNGAVNQVYRVQASLGNFYLRLYKTSERARVEREHALLEYVAAHNLPAVQTLPSRYGSSLIEHDGKFGALYFESPGKQIPKSELTAGHAQAAGKMLAQLHKILKPLPDVGYRKYSLNWNGPEWVERLNRIESAILARTSLNEADQWVLQRLRAQRQWLQDPVCAHSYVPKFPAQVLHGDYHQGNLFFQKETVCGVIDWDQAVFMPRAFEVVRVASYMFDLQPELSRVFLKAYLDLNPLSAEELADGAKAWGCHYDHYVWAQEEIYLNNNERARVFIPEVPFVPFHVLWEKLGLGRA